MGLLQRMVPDMVSDEAEVLQGYPGYNKIMQDQQSATSEESASLFDAINQRYYSREVVYIREVDQRYYIVERSTRAGIWKSHR